MINIGKCKQGKITKGEAALATANESVGMGVSAGFGLLASNVVRASLVLAASTTPSLLPFAVGVVVTAGTKSIWDSKTKKHIERRYEVPEQNSEIPAPAA